MWLLLIDAAEVGACAEPPPPPPFLAFFFAGLLGLVPVVDSTDLVIVLSAFEAEEDDLVLEENMVPVKRGKNKLRASSRYQMLSA